MQHPLDQYSLGKWQVDLGLRAAAETSLRSAISGDLPLEYYHRALNRLGLLLKRDGRREEAVPIWQKWAATSFDDVSAHVELAMYYEWHDHDLAAARHWTQNALQLVDKMGKTPNTGRAREDLAHRLARLERKMAG